jgi:hypothetical protein
MTDEQTSSVIVIRDTMLDWADKVLTVADTSVEDHFLAEVARGNIPRGETTIHLAYGKGYAQGLRDMANEIRKVFSA